MGDWTDRIRDRPWKPTPPEVNKLLMSIVLMGHNTCKKCGQMIMMQNYLNNVKPRLLYSDIRLHIEKNHEDLAAMIVLMGD